MDNKNFFRPPRRESFLEALRRRQQEQEPKTETRPDRPRWWEQYLDQRRRHEALKLAVWQKASEVPPHDPAIIRRDSWGSLIVFSDYGKTDSETGWQFDHIIPRAHDGTEELSNLQPLHCKNNSRKSDHIIPPPPPRRPWSL